MSQPAAELLGGSPEHWISTSLTDVLLGLFYVEGTSVKPTIFEMGASTAGSFREPKYTDHTEGARWF